MISRGTPHCSSDSWMYSKVHISSAVLFFILVTVHQGTCATLKGQKAVFQLSAPDEYGTLSPGTNIPSLGSFTLCIDIRLRQNNKNRMIAFTYNTDIKRMHSVRHHELGIMIKDRRLVIWLFHKPLNVKKDISFASWHSVCLTWNGNTRETHVYLNRTHVLSKTLNNAYSLGQNGSLVLGRKHSRGADRLRLDREIFVGDLYLFRLWDRAKGLQSISQQDCEDGNVITWDSQQWDFVGSILKYDPSLPCTNTMIPSGRPGKLSIAGPKSENTGSTSSEVTLSPSSTKEISMTPTGTSSPPNMTEISTTPTKMSSPPNTTEISTPTEIPSPSNTTEINRILNGTSPRMNRTENSTTPTGTSSPGNTTGNSFINATSSPMTENSTALTGTLSAANTTGNSFTNAANSPMTVDHTTLTGTSSPSNTTGNSFTNAAISPLTENSTALTGTSSPANTTVNSTTVTGSSSPQDRTATSLNNTTISPITENSTAVTGSLLPWDRTVNTMTTTVRSSRQNTTENFISNMTNSPETANSTTITGTSSPQNTTGNSVTNKSRSPGTEDSIPTNGTSAPQITTVNITTGIETSLPQITTVNNSPENGTSTTKNTTVYTASSPQDTTVSTATINETLSTQKTTGNSTTKMRTQPGTVYIITVNKTSTTQNTTGTERMTIATNRTSASQTMPVNSTIITTSSPLQNTTVNGTETETETSPQNTTVNSTIITTSSPLQNTTEDPLMISPTDASAVALIVTQLEKILQMESINEELAVTLVNTISNLINASVDAVASSSRQILDIVDTIGEKLNFTTDSINISSPFLALAVNKIKATTFSGADFSITNITNLQVSLNEESPQASFAAIELPSSLLKNLSSEEVDNVSRIQFSFHEKPTLFQDSNIGSASVLNSYIIASSVNANISISDLADPVKITFKNLQLTEDSSIVECVFWDFLKNNASGGWNSEGCTTAQNTSNQTVCECNHLTHFGVLLTISRNPVTDPVQERILTFITYIGCGLSSICLAMTLVTYLVFEKLRRDYPSKILINLCTALLFLNIVFLIDSWISVYRIEGLCIAVAALLHYFLLASFTWMSLEALHMYLALVKVFNTYVRRYILKFCILGWGIPIVVVAIILGTGAVGRHNYGLGPYGRKTNTTLDEFCWINNDTTFYVAAVGYFCIMFLVNLSMFIVVLTQLCQIKSKQHHQNAQKSVLRNIRSVAGLTFLLGITWGFAFFAWGPVNLPFMYLFAIFNSLQGAFIFIFHCVIKESVQKVWRRYLCCGKLMLPENSDWSITATNNTKKLQPLVQGMSLSSTSNNSLQSTSPLYPVRDYSSHPNVNGAKL